MTLFHAIPRMEPSRGIFVEPNVENLSLILIGGGGHPVPIRPYLNGHKFDPEVVRVLGVAFEIARCALQMEDRNEPAQQAIAAKLIELAQQGERDPDQLAERVLAMVDPPSSSEKHPRPPRPRRLANATHYGRRAPAGGRPPASPLVSQDSSPPEHLTCVACPGRIPPVTPGGGSSSLGVTRRAGSQAGLAAPHGPTIQTRSTLAFSNTVTTRIPE